MREPIRGFAAATLLGAIAATLAMVARVAGAADGQAFAQIERGRYLAMLSDCAACHTDPVTNKPYAGGRAIETPFGKVVAPNITPDWDTGIGGWTDDEFDAAVRQGKMANGARIYPAMPYPYYAKMSRQDIITLRAYLATVLPVHNQVISDQLPFPFSIRAGMMFWNALYFKPGEFKADESKSPSWNRGAYLVEGPGHCGACHTPKSSLGGDKLAQAYQGYSIQGWFAPDITDEASAGLADWNIADIVDYLKSGHNRFAAASGPMAEEVAHSSSRFTRDDLAAIASYLKDRKGNATHGRPLPANDPVMTAGAAIFSDSCSACHVRDGSGIANLIPNLAASASVASRAPTTILQVVLRGANSVATDEEPTAPAMPAYGWQLTDAQVAAVATFIRNSWGHAAPAVSEAEVAHARAAPSGGR